MKLKVGDKAPGFTLKNQFVKDISLSDYKNKNIVLLFFPFVNSSVCTTEIKKMQSDLSQYENLNAEIIGMSVDSHYALKLWSDVNNITFNLLSDFNKETAQKYDVFYEYYFPEKYNYKGVSKRAVFVIGKDGLIKYIEVCPTPAEEPSYQKIKEILKSL